MPRIARLIVLLLLILPLLVISGCFPSSFELTSEKAALTDQEFVLLHGGFFHEAGETTVVGRTISYEADNYAGVWTNGTGLTIVLLTTPSVISMSMEANPIATLGPRAMFERVLSSGADTYATHTGLPAVGEVTLESEQFARLSTNFGGLNGGRFLARSGDQAHTAIIVHGKHQDDFLVILVLFDPENEPDSLRTLHRVLNTLEHPVIVPESGRPTAAILDVIAAEFRPASELQLAPIVP
jgi:hypothetical protein